MKEPTIGSDRLIYCNWCERSTHHELKANHSSFFEDEELDDGPPYWEEHQYRFWVCKGCDAATLEVVYNIAGQKDSEGDKVWYSLDFYPKRRRSDWPLKRFNQLDEKLAQIHREVIASFNADLKILCAIGLRALMEGVCADKGITGRSLQERIDGLNILPSNIVESLHSFRFMGNDAAHELQAPRREDLRLAIEVIEDLLNFLYELDYKARRLPKK